MPQTTGKRILLPDHKVFEPQEKFGLGRRYSKAVALLVSRTPEKLLAAVNVTSEVNSEETSARIIGKNRSQGTGEVTATSSCRLAPEERKRPSGVHSL